MTSAAANRVGLMAAAAPYSGAFLQAELLSAMGMRFIALSSQSALRTSAFVMLNSIPMASIVSVTATQLGTYSS